MGGAQAIAALAYGTETVDRVDVVVGPGNLYVQEAKRLLATTVGIDGFAGPSDLLVALDAELGGEALRLGGARHARAGRARRGQPRGGGFARRPGDGRAGRAARGARRRTPDRRRRRRSRSSRCRTRARRWPSRTRFAPEHLQLIGEQMEALAPAIRSAGCLFVGTASATAFGDYVAGCNHVLPTGGAARFASMLSARHFRRRMAEVRIGDGGRQAGRGGGADRPRGGLRGARRVDARLASARISR